MEKKALDAALRSIDIEAGAVQSMEKVVRSKEFEAAVEILGSCSRIMTVASGSSGAAAKKFAHSLCCIERGAMYMAPSDAVHGGLGALKPEDAMVMISHGGRTAELLPIIDVCKKKGAKLIGVTGNPDSELACASDVVLPLNIDQESDKYNCMATASYAATIALFDALLCALIETTGYTVEQFALIHPGGAVGERLNGKR